MISASKGSRYQSYLVRFRELALRIVVAGHFEARPEVGPNSVEPDITTLLADAVDRLLNSATAPAAYRNIFVKPEVPISGTGRHGKHRHKIDIYVESNVLTPRPSLHCEAKRLRTPGFPVSRYVGSDGMELFVAGHYAPDTPDGAMLGYVQSGKLADWAADIGAAIRQDAANRLNVVRQLGNCTLATHLPHTYESTHRRSDGSMIRISHVLLDCT